jgi:hypothetical protein
MRANMVGVNVSFGLGRVLGKSLVYFKRMWTITVIVIQLIITGAKYNCIGGNLKMARVLH